MSRDPKAKNPGALGWLGLADPPDWTKARWLGSLITVGLILLMVWVLLIAIGALAAMTGAIFSDQITDLRGIAVFVTAVFGAPFLIWRTVIAAKQAALQDEALFNDKINAAAGDLAARRQVTRVITVEKDGESEEKVLTEWQDDVVTRSAAIDRLEGLARERAQVDPSIVPRIAGLLSVYVRELSKEDDFKPKEHGLSEEEATPKALREWAGGLRPIRSDMEKAAQVLGRLRRIEGQEGLVIDLREANLQGFDLKSLDFDKAQMVLVRLEGADLSQAEFKRANLAGAKLLGGHLNNTNLDHSDLSGAQLECAQFWLGSLRDADLSYSSLRWSFIVLVKMQDAALIEADLRGTDLHWARLDGATLRGIRTDYGTGISKNTLAGACLYEVEWSSKVLPPNAFNSAFGDATVVGTFNRPDWWPDLALADQAWLIEFKHWRANPDTYDWSQRRQHYTASGKINPDNPPPEYKP